MELLGGFPPTGINFDSATQLAKTKNHPAGWFPFWSCWADSNRRPHPYQVIKCPPAVAAQGFAGVFTAKRMRSKTLCSMCSVRSFPRVGHSVGQTILGHKGGLNLRQWQAESFRSVLLIGDTGHLLNKIPPFRCGACPAHAIFLTQVEENLVKAFSS